MSSTTGRGLIQPTVGGDTAAWGGYLNNNFGYINQMFGTILEISVTSGATLTTTQTQNGVIRFTGTLTSNVDVNFPNVSGVWWIDNRTTGNYYVRVKMTTGANATIGLPQGVITPVRIESGTDGGTTAFPGASFLNAPVPGTLWDYTSGTAPVWFGGCTSDGTTAQFPWLVCDGSVYNINAYPYLGGILGSTWGGNGATTFGVPDLRNKVRTSVKPSSPLLTSSVSGIDGSVVGSSNANESTTLTIGQLPIVTPAGTNAASAITSLTMRSRQNLTQFGANGADYITSSGIANATDTSSLVSGTVAGQVFTGTPFGGGQAHTSVQPTVIHGLTFIKT